MWHAMEINGDKNDIGAEPTLTELIDNNTDVLENRIPPQTIQRFVNCLLEGKKDAKYVKLLTALVNNEGEAVINNQKQVCEKLLNEQVINKILFRVE